MFEKEPEICDDQWLSLLVYVVHPGLVGPAGHAPRPLSASLAAQQSHHIGVGVDPDLDTIGSSHGDLIYSTEYKEMVPCDVP